MGGVVPMTPVHAFDSVPAALQLTAQPQLQPTRQDIELGGLLAFVIDQVTTEDEADAMVQASEQCGYRDEAPGIATPPGMRVRGYAKLMKIEGRILTFEVWAEDEFERIGEGVHERAVIDRARFDQRVQDKARRAG